MRITARKALALLGLLVTPALGAIVVHPPHPIADLQYGGASDVQAVPSVIWDGEHFLSVWIEREAGSTAETIVAARFTETGERIDPFGIEILSAGDIRQVRVVATSESHILLWSDDSQLNVVTLNEELQPGTTATIPNRLTNFFSTATESRVLIAAKGSITHSMGNGVVYLLDHQGALLAGPLPIELTDDIGVAAGEVDFMIVTTLRDEISSRVQGHRVSFDGEIGDRIEIASGSFIGTPSVAFTGSHYLVAYGETYDNQGFHLRPVSGEGVGAERTIGPSSNTASISCNEENCFVAGTSYEPCRILCVPAAGIQGALVSHDGDPLEELRPVAVDPYYSRGEVIASSPTRHFVTWEHSGSWSPGAAEGMIVDGAGDPEGFPLSLSATLQKGVKTAGDEHRLLVTWEESEGDKDELCLRASIRDARGVHAPIDLGRCIADSDLDLRDGRHEVSWDGNTWLVSWLEQSEENPTRVRGRIIDPEGNMGETFDIMTGPFYRIAASGADDGHVVVASAPGSILASRVSSTGLVIEEAFHVVWNELTYGILELDLTRLGDGFVLAWRQACNAPLSELCGLLYRRLDAEGHTIDSPAVLSEEPYRFLLTSSGDSALITWSNIALGDDQAYHHLVRTAVLRDDGSSSPARTILNLVQAPADISATPHGGGFLLSVVEDFEERAPTRLIPLDSTGAPAGPTTTFDGSIVAVTTRDGKLLLIEQKYLAEPPYYGADRLFVRTIEEPSARRRPLRR